MLIFIDQINSEIKVYCEKGLEVYELDEVDDLAKKMGKKKALYVTQVLEVTGSQVVQTVNGLLANSAGNTGFEEMDNQTYYLQSNKKGVLHISEIGMKFEGPGDCKLLDQDVAQRIQESPVLRSLLRDKVIQIVDYATMRKAARKQERQKNKSSKDIRASRDKGLDDIIVKSDRPGSALDIASGMFNGPDDDVVTTDITEDVKNDPTEDMSEDEIAELMRQGKLGV
jgi:hypothetical protein